MDNEKDIPLSDADSKPDVQETAVQTEQPETSEESASEIHNEESPADKGDSPKTDGETAAVKEVPEAEAEKKDKTPKKSLLTITSDLIFRVVAAMLFVFAAATVVYYIGFAAKNEFHADCTDTIMWANASVESGSLYDKEFTYACFLPFSTSTLMIPLIKLFGFGMTAHICGMMGFFIILTVFLVLMLRELTGSFPAAFSGAALFLSLTLSTEKMREIFWGHTIYYSLGILFLVIGVWLYARLLAVRSRERKCRQNGTKSKGMTVHWVIIFICLCCFMLLTGMDGITGLTLFALPFAGAVFAEHFVNTKYSLLSRQTLIVTIRAAVFLIMAVIGNLINNKLLGDLTAFYTEGNSEFSDMNSWLEHLQKLPFAWMRLFGVENMPDTMFTDEEGIPNLIRIAASLIIAVMPLIATFCYKKYGNDRTGRLMKIWIWIHWAVTAVVLTGYIFGILAAADWRIIPVIGTSIIVSILFVFRSVSQKADSARIAVLLIIPVVAVGYLNCLNVQRMPKDGYKSNTQFRLAEFLDEQGVTRGYATFWNANSVTLITDGKIKVSDVNVDVNGISQRSYQSSGRWYTSRPFQDEYFLLLSQYEFNEFRESEKYANETPLRTAETVIDNITYMLFIYDHNIV